MKRNLLFFLFFLLLCFPGKTQNSSERYYYYYNKEQIDLFLDRNYINLVLDDEFLKSSSVRELFQNLNFYLTEDEETNSIFKLKFISTPTQGIDRSHYDLAANLDLLSFDTHSGTSPSIFIPKKDHGTHVCGIAAAVGNNTLQVVGVAHESKVLGVGNSLDATHTTSAELASGFAWAWQNEADVINNSWGDDGGNLYQSLHSDILEESIIKAMRYGRNGKGCVVVFATGNQGIWRVDYPGNFNDSILTVGAIDSGGYRYSASNYGNKLDMVAPGKYILSTMPNNETKLKNGTSFAAPHVSGVAALVLSVNPELTGQQVRNIIESTAQKVGGYNYQPTVGRSNGTWHQEMGYGLVDAYAAVFAARCYNGLPIVHGTITQNTTWNTDVHAIGNITIPNGINLSITSTVKCDHEASILIHPGGKLILDGGTLTNACNGEMWQGITVMGDPNLPASTLFQGYVHQGEKIFFHPSVCSFKN